MARFKVEAIRLYNEDSIGVKPVSPKNFLLQTATDFGLAEEPSTEDVETLSGGGEASGKLYGASAFGGDIPIVLTGEMLPFIANYLFGEATKAAATTDLWAATTAQVIGDLVNHSDGVHTLVCSKDGTTGGIEPDVSLEQEYAVISDDSTEWIVRPTLHRYTGTNEPCMSTFGVELQLKDADCAGASEADVYLRYGGCYLGTSEFGKSGEDISIKSSMAVKASNYDNNVSNTSYDPQGGTDVSMNKAYMENCNVLLYLDGTLMVDTTEFKMTTDRSLSEDKDISCGNIVYPGTIKHEGSASLLFGRDEFLRSELRTSHEYKIEYRNKGDVGTIIYPDTRFGKTPPVVSTDKFTTLAPDIYAVGTDAVPSVNYDIVSGLDL